MAKESQCSPHILVLFLLSSTVRASLWSVSIDLGPAPAPEDGPPFSAHASRNRALLPYQICGIIGAYIGSILILGTLFLTVGRRLRRQAQSSHNSLAMEMVKPVARTFGASPISTTSTQNPWYSPRRLKKKSSAQNSMRSGMSNPVSPGSVVSFDPNVIEADKAARQLEMERLYEAVMAQDARKSQGTVQEVEVPELPPPRPDARRPPRLLTSAPALRHLHIPSNPASPSTPKSPVRAIYPPDSSMPPMPSSPTSPIRAEYPTTPLTPVYPCPTTSSFHQHIPAESVAANRVSHASSFGSQRSTAASGERKKFRKSLRRLQISAPLPRDEDDDSAKTPLSPRFYANPGVPPSPPGQHTATSDTSTTPGTAGPYGSYPYAADNGEWEIDQIRDLPRPAPQRMGSYQYNNTPQALTDTINATSPRPVVPSIAANTGAQQQPRASSPRSDLPLRNAGANTSASNLNAPLPFRTLALQQNPALTHLQPSQQPRQPGHPQLLSPVKTTLLSPRRDFFHLQGGLRTAGVPQTPYSPYMPFTPITPVTPRLTSRAERRAREREEGRRVLDERDRVVEEDDMWGSGY